MSNAAASVRARLLNIAKAQGVDFNQVLVRYALERMLYRLSASAHSERFLLKGALLFTLWYDMPHRTTRDADLLGFGASDVASLVQVFRDVAGIAAEDGIVFDPASVIADENRKNAVYAGARVLISGQLAGARCKTQIDVGFGDATVEALAFEANPVLAASAGLGERRQHLAGAIAAGEANGAIFQRHCVADGIEMSGHGDLLQLGGCGRDRHPVTCGSDDQSCRSMGACRYTGPGCRTSWSGRRKLGRGEGR